MSFYQIKPTEKELEALVRLKGNTDFEVFRELLKRCQEECAEKALEQIEPHEIFRRQGEVKVFVALGKFAVAAKAMLEALKKRR